MGASGTVLLNFGAHPGAMDATVDVTGQTGLVSTSEVDAWIQPVATAEHTVDEHCVEEIDVFAHYQADGTLRVRGFWSPKHGPASRSNNGHRLYGNFNIGWAWS